VKDTLCTQLFDIMCLLLPLNPECLSVAQTSTVTLLLMMPEGLPCILAHQNCPEMSPAPIHSAFVLSKWSPCRDTQTPLTTYLSSSSHERPWNGLYGIWPPKEGLLVYSRLVAAEEVRPVAILLHTHNTIGVSVHTHTHTHTMQCTHILYPRPPHTVASKKKPETVCAVSVLCIAKPCECVCACCVLCYVHAS
jgi:hypothetical protein